MGALGAEPSNAVFKSIWCDAAQEVGADFGDLGDGFYEIRRGARWTRMWWHVPALDDSVTLRLALNKTHVHRLLAREGLPVPENREFPWRDLEPALALLSGSGGPWVVKPADRTSGGAATTSGVRGRGELMRATIRVARHGRRMLMERQAPGECYRLLFLDGELLDVVRRGPPRVVGDGRSSIDELVRSENRRRIAAAGFAGLRLLHLDLDAVLTLSRAGMTIHSVPAAGQGIAVKTVTNENRVEDNETVRDVSSGLVEEARAAAGTLGLRLAGVDVVTPDPGTAPSRVGGAIIEVNGTPGLHYHYLVADRPRATRVAVPVLRRLLD